jgi:tetratricopeptide (TPR) repeat protein
MHACMHTYAHKKRTYMHACIHTYIGHTCTHTHLTHETRRSKNNIGNAFKGLGKYDEALKWYTEALTTGIHSLYYHFCQFVLLRREALTWYTEAVNTGIYVIWGYTHVYIIWGYTHVPTSTDIFHQSFQIYTIYMYTHTHTQTHTHTHTHMGSD